MFLQAQGRNRLNRDGPVAYFSSSRMLNSVNRERWMGATRIEFRLRVAIMVIVIWLGFWAPWIERWGLGWRIPLLSGCRWS